MEEWDEFVGVITKVGGTNKVTIPQRNMIFSGLKEGDEIKVRYKKKLEPN